jgi:transcriptional regulator with GAF, ATPase, and Fis domain
MNIPFGEDVRRTDVFDKIIGRSDAIHKILSQVEQVAPTRATVLIQGERGTGKELLAEAMHQLSARQGRAWMKVNCAALPSSLVESELFGREKGAYTGALTKQIGRFEAAHGGTIFLDEIGDLPLDMQTKLLRVLQDGQFERLGSVQTLTADVRVIAATNRNLFHEVHEGRFREDLFYRLSVFPLTMPPLRERLEDIPLLVWSFVKEFGQAMSKTIVRIPPPMMEALQTYDWPGNIRELRNVIERAMILTQGESLHIDPPRHATAGVSLLSMTLEEVERRHILSVLAHTGWRVRGQNGAASILGLKPTTLESRMKKLGIRRD